MKWNNVKLILTREVRDQLRDRRTLFMIAVLPLLLYPLLGMSFFQVAQFMHEQPVKVLVLGLPQIEGLPPLVEKGHFAGDLFTKPERARLLKVESSPQAPSADDLTAAQRALRQGQYEVVLEFPADFAERLQDFRAHLRGGDEQPENSDEANAASDSDGTLKVPSPVIFYNTAKETSQIAYLRVNEVFSRWTEAIGRQNLKESQMPQTAAKPFNVDPQDVAEVGHRKAALWSKILPFVLLLWALTGAFYPAVDLCAGEKERGTLETLLSSPAERSEIVVGKLLTIMLFSMTTAILNLMSMGITGLMVVKQMPDFGPPPLSAVFWLLLALVPVSALFSGLCLALAAFARSSKEGQYYLMPLVLVTMPLTILPMSPGVELNLGNSLIPITGIVLLLRTLLEGNYALALPYIAPVVAVTLTCCLLAVRWAADQFNRESVLFRESERLDMGLWLRHLLRDREDTPSAAEAIFCGVLILLIRFFMSLALPPMNTFRDFAVMALVTQLVVIATPALLMTVMLTRSPVQTLLLKRPPWATLPAALLLAIAVLPLADLLKRIVTTIYPISEEIEGQLGKLLGDQPPLGALILVAAVAPAICEELAFRGFILSGLRHLGHKWRAIVLTSIFFGATHAVFQQSLITCVVGAVIGFVAIQTGSLFPGLIFHLVYNTLTISLQEYLPGWMERVPAIGWLAKMTGEGRFQFSWPAILLSAAASVVLLLWFQRLPYARSEEEKLQEAIDQQTAPSAVG